MRARCTMQCKREVVCQREIGIFQDSETLAPRHRDSARDDKRDRRLDDRLETTD